MCESLPEQVGDESIDQWFKDCCDKWGTQEEITCLNPTDALAKIQGSKKSLEELAAKVAKSLAPLRVSELLVDLERVEAEANDAIELCEDFRAPFDELDASATRQKRNERRQDRSRRSKVTQQLAAGEADTVPLALAKHLGELINAVVENNNVPSASGIEFVAKSDAVTKAVHFDEPFTFGCDPTAEATALHTALGEYWSEDFAKLCVEKGVEVAREIAKSDGAPCALSTVARSEKDFPWKEFVDAVDVVQGLRVAVHTARCHAFNVTSLAWPWKGVALLLRVVSGEAAVMVLSKELAVEAGADADAWLRRQDAKVLARCPRFYMTTGTSLWCPFGTVPLVVGVAKSNGQMVLASPQPKLKKGEKQDLGFVTFAVQPCFSGNNDKKASVKVRQAVVASHVLAGSAIPQSIRGCEGVKAWRQALETADDQAVEA